MRKHIKIGTRGSLLATTQSTWVKNQIEAQHPGITVELVIIGLCIGGGLYALRGAWAIWRVRWVSSKACWTRSTLKSRPQPGCTNHLRGKLWPKR